MTSEPAPPHTYRSAFMAGEWVETPAHDFDALAAGQEIAGPAIVDSETTTIVLRRNDRASATPFRWLNIAVGPL